MKSSPITKLAAFVGALSLLALPCVQAEEPERPRPLLLEEGGNLNDFDPATMRLNIQGRSYRIDPVATQVIVISGQGMRKLQLPAGQLSDLRDASPSSGADPCPFSLAAMAGWKCSSSMKSSPHHPSPLKASRNRAMISSSRLPRLDLRGRLWYQFHFGRFDQTHRRAGVCEFQRTRFLARNHQGLKT